MLNFGLSKPGPGPPSGSASNENKPTISLDTWIDLKLTMNGCKHVDKQSLPKLFVFKSSPIQ